MPCADQNMAAETPLAFGPHFRKMRYFSGTKPIINRLSKTDRYLVAKT